VAYIKYCGAAIMSSPSAKPYRISVRPAPGNKSRYLWTIYGIETMFYEASQTEYDSVEDALAEANARLSELA
jgi:hypothetical protein